MKTRMRFICITATITAFIVAIPHSEEVINKHSEELINIFDKFDDMIKSNEFRTPVVCVMSVDELNEIENALVHNGDNLSASNEVNIQFSTNCTEIEKLKTGILKLKNDFRVLVNEQTSSRAYNNLKANYELKLEQFNKRLNDTIETASHEQLEVIDRLKNDLRSQENEIADILRKLESKQKSLNDAHVDLVISQVQQGQFDVAIAAFANITDHEIGIERIIVSVYESNDETFEKNFDFIKRIIWLPSRINGYKTLHEQLKKANHLGDANIWILATAVKNISESTGGLIEAVMDDVKTIVRNNDFDGIIGYLNKRGINGLKQLTYFAPLFIRTIYEESDGSVEKVLNVLRKLTFTRHRLYLLNELIGMLKSNDLMHGKEMSIIVFELIKLRTINKKVMKTEDKSLQNTIEQNLPEELRDLMYKNLCIQNIENDEYLFASVPADNVRRHIYTAKTRSLDESFYWQIHFVANGTKILVKNIKYREHIYLMDEDNTDEDHDHVLRSWIPDSLKGDRQAEFSLDMIGNGQFLIMNNHFGQLLYSPFDDEENENHNRPVFSKKFNPNNVSVDSKWKIGLCKLDVEYVF